MEQTLRVLDEDGGETLISGRQHPDWEGLPDTCPACGATRFRHFQIQGGRYAISDESVRLRASYWDATMVLFTQCLDCECTLRKHPTTDLLYAVDGDSDTVVEW